MYLFAVARYGVFDGHGPAGHDVSNYVRRARREEPLGTFQFELAYFSLGWNLPSCSQVDLSITAIPILFIPYP